MIPQLGHGFWPFRLIDGATPADRVWWIGGEFGIPPIKLLNGIFQQLSSCGIPSSVKHSSTFLGVRFFNDDISTKARERERARANKNERMYLFLLYNTYSIFANLSILSIFYQEYYE